MKSDSFYATTSPDLDELCINTIRFLAVDAIQKANSGHPRNESQRPSLVVIRTHIGYGSPDKQDSFEAHGSPLGPEEVRLSKERLDWPVEPSFLIPEQALEHFREALVRGSAAETSWDALLGSYAQEYPELAEEFRQVMEGDLPSGWDRAIPNFPADKKGIATRVATGKALNAVAAQLPLVFGGSADLDPSTYTALKGMGDFESAAFLPTDRQGAVGGEWGPGGTNIHFGVREHAMGAILNGLAAHGGVIPFGATFLTFSDYLRPTLRLAALSGLHVIHIFTHDSIGLGEDGPTHQPVEHLASLRAIPRLVVMRPGDANEACVALRMALAMKGRPVALVLSRQAVPTLDRTIYASAEGVARGGYVLAEAQAGPLELILIATGSELSLALEARLALAKDGVRARVVSLPSWEIFDEQPQDYQDAVLPPGVTARLSIEAGSPQGWHRYVGSGGGVLAVEDFGASAPGEVVLREYGFTVERVCSLALALLGRAGKGE